jgi:hypothetical protein
LDAKLVGVIVCRGEFFSVSALRLSLSFMGGFVIVRGMWAFVPGRVEGLGCFMILCSGRVAVGAWYGLVGSSCYLDGSHRSIIIYWF